MQQLTTAYISVNTHNYIPTSTTTATLIMSSTINVTYKINGVTNL